MIFLLVVITVFLMVYVGSIRTKTIMNPLTFFLIFWGFWVCLSTFNPYTLYSVSEKAYLLIWINMFTFSIGFIMIARKKNRDICINPNLSIKMNKALKWMETFLFIILIYYFIKYNTVLSSMAITDARRISSEIGYIFGNHIEYLIYNYFVTSLVYLSIIINSVKYSLDKKTSIHLIITLVNIYLFAGIGLGRFVFFNTIIFIIVALNIYRGTKESNEKFGGNVARNKIKRKKSKIKYVPLVGLGVYLMTITTATRYGASIYNFNTFWRWFNFSLKQGAVYFLGPFRALDSFLQLNSITPFDFTFGRATLAGLEEIINNVFILIGININTANSIMASFTVNPITIGYNGETFNAFYTGITNFYLDGGVGFVIMVPLIFGMIIAGCWNLFNRSPNLYTFSILVFMVKTSIAYQYRWDFSTPSNWIVVIALYWLYQREKRYQAFTLKERN